MALEILAGPRVRSVPWQDLRSVRPIQRVVELTGLRQVHNAFHYALGLSQRATEWLMVLLSIAMPGSMHAVKFNHLQHHKFC